MTPEEKVLLVINAGSSSIKVACFTIENESPNRIIDARVEGIGRADSTLGVQRASAEKVLSRIEAETHVQAFNILICALGEHVNLDSIVAIGHRIVQGGPDLYSPAIVTPEVVDKLKSLVYLNPTHLPFEIELLEICQRKFSDAIQVVDFDTGFHHGMPFEAQTIAVPKKYHSPVLRRYGFHGISYRYLLRRLEIEDPVSANGRVILAHLGAGASMAAVKAGVCIDTTMGFSPTGGLVMERRSGDLDPGVITYLIRTFQLSADELDSQLNQHAGMTAIHGAKLGMQELVVRMDSGDDLAARAVTLFCYQAKKFIGALAASLGGLDAIVFSGGIGENCPTVRRLICSGLDHLGIHPENSRVKVSVMKTDEEAEIARSILRFT